MTTEYRPFEANGHIVTVTGWACDKCNKFYGNSKDAEYLAKMCCTSDRPCEKEGCSGRAEKYYVACKKCIDAMAHERLSRRKVVDWDGVTPLFSGDKFLQDVDDVCSLLDEYPDADLEMAAHNSPRFFDMEEYLHDVLPDDYEDYQIPDTTKINNAVNSWIEKHSPFSWRSNNTVPSNKSILEHTGIARDEVYESNEQKQNGV